MYPDPGGSLRNWVDALHAVTVPTVPIMGRKLGAVDTFRVRYIGSTPVLKIALPSSPLPDDGQAASRVRS